MYTATEVAKLTNRTLTGVQHIAMRRGLGRRIEGRRWYTEADIAIIRGSKRGRPKSKVAADATPS